MPFLDPVSFQGTLSGHGRSVAVSFSASIDDQGRLQLELERLPFSADAFALHVSPRPTESVDLLTLEGRSEAGHIFQSSSFTIMHYNHGSEAGRELNFQGECFEAELDLPAERKGKESGQDGLVWRVRQFRTFRRIARDTPLGRVIIGGPQQDQEAQEPSGYLAIFRSGDDQTLAAEGSDWWAAAEKMLTHVARVLSFACDTYLRPVLQERFEDGTTRVRIVRHGRASSSFLAPFHELHMEPIFACACDSYFDRMEIVEQLDPAIRWLTAPVFYDEMRLINAMSALENILDNCDLAAVGKFMSGSAFKRLENKVKALLLEVGVPDGMIAKIPELNRPPLHHKVMALLDARGLIVSDFPEDWLETVIKQRNTIVHTGISADLDESRGDTLDHTIWVREVVTRIILERLGFTGAYRSWLHADEQFRFPECIPMGDWVRQQESFADEQQ